MNRHSRNFIFGFLFAVSSSAWGQDVPQPVPIMVAPAPQMEWTMTLESGAAGKTSIVIGPWDATSWVYTHLGKLTKIIVTYPTSGTREYWRFSHVTVCQNVALHTIEVREDSRIPPYPCASDGFYGLKNVKPTDDRGISSFEGSNYHYFRGSNVEKLMSPKLAPTATGSSQSPPTYEAWFDLKTGLPKAYREKDRTFLYQFSRDVPGELQLPPKYQEAVNRYRENLRKIGVNPDF